MNSFNKISKFAGVLYLIITFVAPFSMLYVPSKLIVAGDALATAANIQSSKELFRAAIVSDALVFLLEIALTVLVYQLVKPVDKTLALISAYARLGMTVIQGVNVLNYIFVLLLVSGAGYLSAFASGQPEALVSLFLQAHDSTALIWGLFFGLPLLVLGYLVPLRQIRVEIILPIEAALLVDLGIEPQARTDRLLHAELVDHRQHARHRRVDEADVCVWFPAIGGRGP